MPTFADLATTLTARLGNEEDFAFHKTKEELALKIRAEQLPAICECWGVPRAWIGIDDDGDIRISSVKGTLYVTKDALILGAVPAKVASLHPLASEASRVLDQVFPLIRVPLKPTSFGVRLYIRLRFVDGMVVQTLQPHRFFQCITTIPAPHVQINGLEWLNWEVAQSEREFSDAFEIHAEPSSFVARYNRDSTPDKFSSFQEFGKAADVPTLVERLRPFIEPVIADPSKIRGNAFLE
jgi:hypothetical protein